MKYAAFLRAVNVAGRNRIPMDELAAACIEGGFHNVATYVQSGNIVFKTPPRKRSALEEQLAGIIKRRFGLEIDVFVRSADDLTSLINGNPLLDRDHAPEFLHVTLFKGAGKGFKNDAARAVVVKGEEFAPAQDGVYLFCPHGYGRTKLNNANWEKWCGDRCTTRNWNTIGEIARLLRE
jgi:uncharacterized protein (DUF1697 family)